MGLLGGLLGKIVGIAVMLIVLLAAIGGLMYAADAKVGATVIEKDCLSSHITVRLKVLPFLTPGVDVERQQCGVIQVGNYVEYYVRSGRATIYESPGGACVYDTLTGPGCGTASGPSGGLFGA